MSYQFPDALQRIVSSRMKTGKYRDEDELLLDAFRALSDEEEDIAAINEAIGDWSADKPGSSRGSVFEAMIEGQDLAEG
ncbi:hypothetical protein Pan216_13970 [Planctomycetes bacterium Pan216]|uniref:Antitoxin ParD4 n=1 Tax=Kolteria novifilia TaxID=2527975 RepID=A0A518B0Q9_9BACT|nr:hypothetical protein Pan216_13970 [Planctomycetes bacterium Pan216]